MTIVPSFRKFTIEVITHKASSILESLDGAHGSLDTSQGALK